jgi:hypothetical protein
MHPVVIARWHEIVRSHDASALADLLADDVVFASPVVHTPQLGRALTLKYLGAALKVLNNGSFKYLNEWHGAHSAVLEFEATCEDILINGVDIVSWNDDQKITAFKVMVRPLKAINKLHELMARQLTAA